MKEILARSTVSKFSQVSPISREFLCFVACAEAGSMLRAAERLKLQQAGLSKVIKRLEETLGQKLFLREARGVKLTAYGKVLLESLLKTDEFWSLTYADQIQANLGLSGSFKIVCHSSIAVSNLPRFLGPVTEAFPHINFQFEFMRSVDATRAILEGRADLGLVINPIKNPSIVVRKVTSEFVSLWKSHGDNDKVLLINPEMFRKAELQEKFFKRKVIEIPDYETIASAVASSDLQGILPSPVAGRYRLKQASSPLISVNLSLVYNRNRLTVGKKISIVHLISQSLSGPR